MGIEIKKLNKIFNEGKANECEALKNISLSIDNGELIAIKGKSGAGKSTLLHIIGCIDKMTSGKYILDDIDISKLSNSELAKYRNSKFGYIMQDFGLIHDETVYENIILPLLFSNKKIDIKKKSLEIMRKLKIEHLRDRKVEVLSGGEKQRVAIARALVNNPDYILADEPTGALDNNNTRNIMGILQQLNNMNKTVIIITHDDDVAAICKRCIEISDGEISNI